MDNMHLHTYMIWVPKTVTPYRASAQLKLHCRRPPLVAGWLLRWLLGLANWLLVSWWLACWLICWLAAVLLAGWLVGWLVGWLLVGWLDSIFDS